MFFKIKKTSLLTSSRSLENENGFTTNNERIRANSYGIPKTNTVYNTSYEIINEIKAKRKKMSKEVIRNRYDLINKIEKVERIESSTKYFSTNLFKLDCTQHIKFLDLNYSCVDYAEEMFPKDSFLFVVERNFQKYFMRVADFPIKYEVLLEKALKIDGFVLNLLEHKTTKSRFVGIYKYEENYGTLDTFIETTNTDLYTRYSLMHTLAKMVSTIFENRDPKNPYLNMNLCPTNLLMLSGKFNSMKIIKVFPSTQKEIMKMIVPEKEFKVQYVDKRASHVYNLGKLFYFIIFRIFPTRTDSTLLNFLSDFKIEDFVSEEKPEEDLEEEKSRLDIHPQIIYLIRRMLNSSPVDRPSFPEILEIIMDVKSESDFFFDEIKERMHKLFRKMKSEVEVESFKNHIKNAHQISMNSVNIDSIKPEVVNMSKLLTKNNKNRNLQFLNSQIQEETNLKDRFGMIKDVALEDFIDEDLRESINKKRLAKSVFETEDLRDEYQEINEFENKGNKVEETFLEKEKTGELKKFEKKLKIEFKSMLKNQILLENKEILMEKMKSNHNTEDSHFPFEYILLIMFTLIVLVVFISSLFFRNSKFGKWRKCQFQAALVMVNC